MMQLCKKSGAKVGTTKAKKGERAHAVHEGTILVHSFCLLVSMGDVCLLKT